MKRFLLSILLTVAAAQSYSASVIPSPNPVIPIGATSEEIRNYREGMIPTPPMGWNSWYASGVASATETNLWDMANYLISSGLRNKGYNYIICDGGWTLPATNALSRNPDGTINYDTNKFPNGFGPLVTYLHNNGMKFGIHTETVAVQYNGLVGSAGHFAQDAKSFASWGVDYVKWDIPSYETNAFRKLIRDICDAVDSSGRAMPIYTAVPATSPVNGTPDFLPFSYLNMVRWVGDQGVLAMEPSYSQYIKCLPYSTVASKGHYMDFDVITWTKDGGGVSTNRLKSTFGLQCLMNSQLMLGSSPAGYLSIFNIIGNEDAIAIDQDTFYPPATVISSNSLAFVLKKKLRDGSIAVGFWNADTNTSQTISIGITNLGFIPISDITIKDIYARTTTTGTSTNGIISATVDAGSLNLYKIYQTTPVVTSDSYVTTNDNRQLELSGPIISTNGLKIPTPAGPLVSITGPEAGKISIGGSVAASTFTGTWFSGDINTTNVVKFPQVGLTPTGATIGGSVGSTTNYVIVNLNGLLKVYWSDGSTVWSKQLAP